MKKIKKLIHNPHLFFYDYFKKRVTNQTATTSKQPQALQNTTKHLIPQNKASKTTKHATPQKKQVANAQFDKKIFMQICDFADSYPTMSLKIDDEYIWPYLRSHLWLNINFVSIGYDKFKTINPYGVQYGHKTNLPFIMRKEIIKRYGAQEIKDIVPPKKPIDFLFITSLNAAEHITLDDGTIYNRITSPLKQIASQIGTCERIEIIKANTTSLKKIKHYSEKPLLILPPHIYKSGYHENLFLHEEFFSRFKLKIPSQIINKKILQELVDWEMHTRDYYIDLLRKLQPKVVLFNGFHYYAPLISAADFLGIVTVDIQHGLQAGWNPLYNHWDEMPPEGYQALPDFFAVWGKKEYHNIKKVFTGEKHEPIIIGNLWFEMQRNSFATINKKIKRAIQGYNTKVMIAMQNQTQIPNLFKKIIEDSSDEILWIIRHHPKGEKYKPKDFSKTKKNILIMDEIDKAQFAQLFPHIDIMISEGSALAIEADGFGVYNVITSEQGKDNYIDEIEDKKFFYIKTSEDFYKILQTIDLSDKTPKVDAFEKADVKAALKKMLKKYEDKQKEEADEK